ncbi:MAG: hypothetical protein ABJL67_21530, partial [Sulfitobacter sp.]
DDEQGGGGKGKRRAYGMTSARLCQDIIEIGTPLKHVCPIIINFLYASAAVQLDDLLLRPIMPRTRTQGTHAEYVLHPHVDGNVEDMQEAPNAERTYEFFRENDDGPRCIATFHLLLLQLLRCRFLLLLTLAYT